MNRNILVVEDDAGLRSTLSLRLSSAGYRVDTAMDGVEAFEKATSQPFDLIILDLMLPVRSGLDVCRDIRRAGLATPILMLTALHQTTDKVVGLKVGASRSCCDTSRCIPAPECLSLAPSAWICDAEKSRVIKIQSLWPRGNFSCSNISSNKPGEPCRAANCYAPSGASRVNRRRARLTLTWPPCATSWKLTPSSPS